MHAYYITFMFTVVCFLVFLRLSININTSPMLVCTIDLTDFTQSKDLSFEAVLVVLSILA